jgi:sulfur carrier protein
MKLMVNGEARELADGTTVAQLVESLGDGSGGRGMAVALDGQVVRRGEWPETRLRNGARVEIVVAVQGG